MRGVAVTAADRLMELLAGSDLDLICLRLAENILSTTYYAPVWGGSAALFSAAGQAALIAPRREAEFIPTAFGGEVVLYEPGADVERQLAAGLARLLAAWGAGRRVGIDLPGGVVSVTATAGDVRLPSPSWPDRLAGLGLAPVGANPLVEAHRLVKDERHRVGVRRANRFAARGLATALADVRPGMREVDLAARLEGLIASMVGDEGTTRARANAFVQAGPQSAQAGDLISISGPYALRDGDLCVVELATCVDGYWSDLTRTVAVGRAGAERAELLAAVQRASWSALQAVRPGVPAGAVDAAARAELASAGLAEAFTHGVGHGVGFVYHEAPILAPGATDRLAEGMIVTIEPGAYVPGRGGARHEENVLVTAAGGEVLSRA